MSYSNLNTSYLTPRLESSNYATWKVKIEMLLIRERLWSIVCGRKKAPAPGTTTKEQIKWEEDAERATATIFLYLGDYAETHVQDIRDPVVIWKKLREIYEMRGFSARFYFWQKLFTLRLVDYHTYGVQAMEMYIDECRSYCQQLRSLGAKLDNEIEASVLLNGLGQGFENFIGSIMQSVHQGKDGTKIDFNYLIHQLLGEYRRRSSENRNDANESNLIQGTLTAQVNRCERYKRQRVECNHCQRTGHLESDCQGLHLDKYREFVRQAYAHATQVFDESAKEDEE